MKKSLLSAALAAAAGLILVPSLARAVEPDVTGSDGDLILGFQLSGENDLEVDIGSLNTYLDATSAFPVTFGVVPADQTNPGTTVTSLNADLTANFGAGWNSNSLLFWGLAGAVGNTVFLSQDSANSNIPQRQTLNGADTTSGDINNTLLASLKESPSTTNSTEAASILTSAAGSWDSFTPATEAFDTGFNIEQAGDDTATDSTLILWELAANGRNGGGNGVDIGSFTLNNSGDLTFTPAVVPEPSTWLSLISGALFLGLFQLRRRSRTPLRIKQPILH
ncbi:MAG: PEP-CTERM sorting domain-containing protein [Chthoniobacteraceae bacterium]|jgi:hypothetical protein